MLSPNLLRRATGSTPAAAELYAAHLSAACAHYGIDTAQRLAAFLPQIGHESGSLRYSHEIADGRAYEGRRDLGNDRPGDGPRYKGRGLIQLTGRNNYRATAARMQDVGAPDFEDFPDAVAEPKWAAWTAAEWWAHHGCNRLADAGQFVKIGRLINRGNADSRFPANGEDDRLRRWDVARAALADWQPSAPQPEEVPDVAPDAPPEPAPAPAPDPLPSSTYSMPAGEAGDWQPPEAPMVAPILGMFGKAALSAVIDAVPDLLKRYSSGSAAAERNIGAATVILDVAKSAVQASNEQELAERVAADPVAREAVRQAVKERWYEIEMAEAGGGGIVGARKADADAVAVDGPWWQILRSPSFVVACLLLPLVYMIVASIIGLIGNAQWSADVRAAIAGTIVGSIVGGLVGYYYGQTTSRNRTPA